MSAMIKPCTDSQQDTMPSYRPFPGPDRQILFPKTRGFDKEERIKTGLAVYFSPAGSIKAATVRSKTLEYGLSRSYLYRIGAQVGQAIGDSLIRVLSQEPDYCPDQAVVLNNAVFERFVLSLALEGKCSLEAITRILSEVFNRDVSTAWVSQVIGKNARKAAEINAELDKAVSPNINVIAMDEIYQGNQPIFTVIDLESTYVLMISPEKDRKSETWEAKMSLMKELGLDPDLIITDACGSLIAAVPKVFGNAIAQFDVFHAMKGLGTVLFRFLRKVDALISEEGDLEYRIKNSRTYETTKNKLEKLKPVVASAVDKAEMVETAYRFIVELLGFSGYSLPEAKELLHWIIGELKAFAMEENCSICKKHEQCRLCMNCNRNSKCAGPDGRICMDCPNNKGCQACKTCNKCPHPDECRFRNENGNLIKELNLFEKNIERTLQFLDIFYQNLAELDRNFPEAYQGIHADVYELWRYRKGTESYFDALDGLNQQYGILAVKRACEEVNKLILHTKRASSLVENLNSRIRPVINAKRQVPAPFMDLLRLKLNTRTYRRSRIDERKGNSPVKLLTGEELDFYDLLQISKPTFVRILPSVA